MTGQPPPQPPMGPPPNYGQPPPGSPPPPPGPPPAYGQPHSRPPAYGQQPNYGPPPAYGQPPQAPPPGYVPPQGPPPGYAPPQGVSQGHGPEGGFNGPNTGKKGLPGGAKKLITLGVATVLVLFVAVLVIPRLFSGGDDDSKSEASGTRNLILSSGWENVPELEWILDTERYDDTYLETTGSKYLTLPAFSEKEDVDLYVVVDTDSGETFTVEGEECAGECSQFGDEVLFCPCKNLGAISLDTHEVTTTPEFLESLEKDSYWYGSASDEPFPDSPGGDIKVFDPVTAELKHECSIPFDLRSGDLHPNQTMALLELEPAVRSPGQISTLQVLDLKNCEFSDPVPIIVDFPGIDRVPSWRFNAYSTSDGWWVVYEGVDDKGDPLKSATVLVSESGEITIGRQYERSLYPDLPSSPGIPASMSSSEMEDAVYECKERGVYVNEADFYKANGMLFQEEIAGDFGIHPHLDCQEIPWLSDLYVDAVAGFTKDLSAGIFQLEDVGYITEDSTGPLWTVEGRWPLYFNDKLFTYDWEERKWFVYKPGK